jgi:hypothetical protein
MYAQWIGEDVTRGPRFRRVTAIRKGDIRKVLDETVADDGRRKYVLEGEGGIGRFGWVDGSNLRLSSWKWTLPRAVERRTKRVPVTVSEARSWATGRTLVRYMLEGSAVLYSIIVHGSVRVGENALVLEGTGTTGRDGREVFDLKSFER